MLQMANNINENCKTTGLVIPSINRNSCEAKGECVSICPYNVFELIPLKDEDKKNMSLVGKLKARAHGGKQAYVIDPALCHSCGDCVKACPEKAITLISIK
ncbi:putative 4Fe-4S ferredoxin, iron-sulfur binding protein [Ferroplasma acidiphilum]|nr:putative 4Fe-4S ferredoxin, iron-sulfur binding protein [Ferroplasma acidiphilum]NOL59826.1 4Fe-4S dicluster domain-containing protein [Ferroplasma acidiphilum]